MDVKTETHYFITLSESEAIDLRLYIDRTRDDYFSKHGKDQRLSMAKEIEIKLNTLM